jgi:hypothetical protein
MTDNLSNNEETSENSGLKSVAVDSNPGEMLEQGRNAAEGKADNAAATATPSTVEDYIPSTSDPFPSNLPSSDHPVPDDSDNPDEPPISASSNADGGMCQQE